MTKRPATEHRLAVLEAIATCPGPVTDKQVTADSAGEGFDTKKVGKMIWILRRDGLISKKDNGEWFMTEAGLTYLAKDRFSSKVPEDHTRPGSRRKKP